MLAWNPKSSIWLKIYSCVSLTSETVFDYAAKMTQVAEIEAKMGAPSFWNNQEKAQDTIVQLKALKAVVGPLGELLAGRRTAVVRAPGATLAGWRTPRETR